MSSKKRGRKGRGARKKKSRVQRRGGAARTIIVLAVIVIAGILAYRAIQNNNLFGPAPTRRDTHKRRDVKVYIADGEGLRALPRSVKKGTLKEELRETFTILLWADSGTVIPPGTTLLGVDVRDGTAYLDFSGAIRENHRGGTSAELQTIYAIVNTMTLNFQPVKRVQILIEGKTGKTLAGHIDISAPLGPYREIITTS